jgi:hypothetical protein
MEVFQKVHKVEYRADFPRLNLTNMLLDSDTETLISLLCMKSVHWRYENEWRALHKTSGTLFHYGANDLKAVYLGPEMQQGGQNTICIIVKALHPNVTLYRGERSSDEFKINFQLASFSTKTKDELAAGI